jgi:sigma-E factor negative regulatory protein RseC
MIEQQGEVVAADERRLSVRLGGRSGCGACDAGRGCGAGVFGRLLQKRPVMLSLDNHLGAHPGQAVLVGVPEKLFLALALRFYLYPVLGGLAGATIGFMVSRSLDMGAGAADLAALLTGAAGAWAMLVRARRSEREFPQAADVHLLRIIESPSCKT